MIKRIFDFSAVFILLLIAALPMVIIASVIRLTYRGPALHCLTSTIWLRYAPKRCPSINPRYYGVGTSQWP